MSEKFREQLQEISKKLAGVNKPVDPEIQAVDNMTNESKTPGGNTDASTQQEPPIVVGPDDLHKIPSQPKELPPNETRVPYFEKRDGNGHVRRYADRRSNKDDQKFPGYVEMTVGEDRTHLPLTAEERKDFVAQTKKIHQQTHRNATMVFWSHLASAAISIIGAVGLGYAMYRGIKHDATKDTKMR